MNNLDNQINDLILKLDRIKKDKQKIETLLETLLFQQKSQNSLNEKEFEFLGGQHEINNGIEYDNVRNLNTQQKFLQNSIGRLLQFSGDQYPDSYSSFGKRIIKKSRKSKRLKKSKRPRSFYFGHLALPEYDVVRHTFGRVYSCPRVNCNKIK